MAEPDEVEVVRQFNGAINARDLGALAALMADEHRFVDMDGNAVDGKRACVEAWRGFFTTFPDYQNHFERVEARRDDLIAVRGRSSCSVAELDGPALWSARVHRERVTEWRVWEDTPTNRRALGFE